MASKELVPFGGELDARGDRRAALEELNQAAEAASSPDEAREIMLKGRALSALLKQAHAPWEEAWLAGKASTVAARRLGKLLNEIDGKPRIRVRGKNGSVVSGGADPSERTKVMAALGISQGAGSNLRRLATVEDPEFQRYIQLHDRIPTVTGALIFANKRNWSNGVAGYGTWQARKRKKVGVKIAKDPSLDEAYTLIVRALGHLGGLPRSGNNPKVRAIRAAFDALYAAEDELKPYRGGYVE